MDNRSELVFEIKNLTKSYGQTIALDDISIKLKRGYITSIYGPNGAGKSTLVKILSGVETQFDGSIWFNNNLIDFSNNLDALKSGVAYIPQDFGLIDNLTALENIAIPHNQFKPKFRYVKSEIEALLDKENELGLKFSNFNEKVGNLTTYEKQILTIYKAFSFNSDIYIFDESTTNLSEENFNHFAKTLIQLKTQGRTIIFISHKIDEIFKISDEIIVLKNGMLNKHENINSIKKEDVVSLFMSNKKSDDQKTKQKLIKGDVRIKMGSIIGVELDFKLESGEIATLETGDTSLNQQLGYEIYNWATKKSQILTGIIPSHRESESIFHNLSIKDNLMANAHQHSRKFMLDRAHIDVLNVIAEKLELKYENWDQSITELSGGNQQKIVFGRWMIADFDILILIEPTSGIDLKSKEIIHDTILDMALAGKSFILITSDIGEKIKLSNKTIEIKQLC